VRSPHALAKLLTTVAVATALMPATPATAVDPAARDALSAVITIGGERCEVTHPIAQTATPVGVGPCPGVRPGAEVWSDIGGCTFNFLFRGFVRDELGQLVEAGQFMGTAGHCIIENEQDQAEVWEPGTGPEARDGNDIRIGEFAYAVNSSTRDFALVRLDAGVSASPQMCHFGGPTGLNDPNFTGSPGVIQHFGQGIVFGQTVAGRTGVGHLSDRNWQFATTAAIFGDSGSGVETEDGRAIGVLVAISPLGIVITRLAPQIEPARQALGLDSLELQTAAEL